MNLTGINILIAVAAILSILSVNKIQAQNNSYKNTAMEITETGYGNLFIKDENNQGINGATITWTPVTIPGDSIPDPYTFITNSVGISEYEVLVFHDSSVGVQNNYNIEVVQAIPNPSSDFTFNFIANQRPDSPIRISSVKGEQIGNFAVTNYENNVAVYHVDLSDKANGIYFATAVIDGKPHTSKLVKIGNAYSGNLGSSAKPIESNFKFAANNEAVYDISIEADGYFTLTDQRIVTVGDQGTDFYTLISDEEPPVDNQDLAGIVTNTNTGNPIMGALIEVEQVGSGQLYTAISTSDGSFTVNGLPLGKSFLFRAGGVAGKEAVKDFPYNTPIEITNPSDSVNVHFGVSLLDDVPSSTSLAHVKDQNLHGTHQDTIWFNVTEGGFNPTQENNIRNKFANLQADENNVYIYAEKSTQSNIGINIESGTYNTNPHEEGFVTPLGNTLYPVLYANTTMAGSSGFYIQFVHEIKRALGYNEVAWAGVESVMEANPQDYTTEDKDIAREASRMYWNAVYSGKTNMPIEYLAEDMLSKSQSQPIKDVKGRIDELKKIAEEKAKLNNNSNNTSSSFGSK